jgi:hypothetical protein
MSFILTACMTAWLRHENARRDLVLRTRGLSLEDYSAKMKAEQEEKGDKAIFYRYTV